MIKSDLQNIVVEISRDGKTGWGTGFYITKDEIATCYHVLASRESALSDTYYIKHGSWTNWKKAIPIAGRCNSQRDFAVMRCEERFQSLPNLSFDTWDGVSREFLSYGYGIDSQKIQPMIKSYYIEGSIMGYTWINEQRRLQVETTRGAIQYGRSGSPVLSSDQKSIVGMLYLAGGEKDIESELILAIPIEEIVAIKSSKHMIDKTRLREMIVRNFTIEDLEILCADIQRDLAKNDIDLQIDLEIVGGNGKAAKVLKLIEYLDHRMYLSYLVDAVHRERPELR